MYDNDPRTVLTLDAGGTNFVFSAIRQGREVVAPVRLPADTLNLNNCLNLIVSGFTQVKAQLQEPPVAISFAFPGPADYENGVIGDLPNFPSFRGGVALGPFLQEQFGIPVFINNDGALFAYGEALAGALPAINKELEQAGSLRRYKNLIAITLGTGFGCGLFINGRLLTGDNGGGGSIWCSANKNDNGLIAEASVSIRALQISYAREAKSETVISPETMFAIAEGKAAGCRDAAVTAFEALGKAAGFAIAELLNAVDGLVVIGGGISGAHKYILPAMINEMNTGRLTLNGDMVPRLPARVYNMEDAQQKRQFLANEIKEVPLPGSEKTVGYRYIKKTGVAISKNGASRSIAMGAWLFALNKLAQDAAAMHCV